MGWKRKVEAVVGITKKTLKLFLLRVSVCVIRMLLTKMKIKKETPKIGAPTKVSFGLILMSLMRIKKLSLGSTLRPLLPF